VSARKAIAVVVVALAAILAPTLMAQAAPRRHNGLIAFSRFRYVDSPVRREIWVANADGSGQRQLTHVGPNYRDSNPDWAPDGSRLVFTRCAPRNGVPGDGRCTIWSVKADGSGLQLLSHACPNPASVGPKCPADSGASYSPDGRSMAFTRFVETPNSISIGDTELRHVRTLFPFGRRPADIGGFAWSPDGKKLAFLDFNDPEDHREPVNGRAVYLISAEGTGLRRVTPWSLQAGGGGDSLSWSPDGQRILFRTITSDYGHPGPPNGNLWTVRPNGTDLRQLTHFPAGTPVQLGSYSPDGQSIVFTTRAGATPKPDGTRSWPDVFVIKADGTGLTPITRTKNWEGTPDWGPSPNGTSN